MPIADPRGRAISETRERGAVPDPLHVGPPGNGLLSMLASITDVMCLMGISVCPVAFICMYCARLNVQPCRPAKRRDNLWGIGKV